MKIKPSLSIAASVLAITIHFLSPATAADCPPFGSGVQIGQVQNSALLEISGVVASRKNASVLWVHNDSGDTARVFAMTTSGTHLGTYNLSGATAVDWEDIAMGPGPATGVDYLYISDTGDNDRIRDSITIYRVPEPKVSASQNPVPVDLGNVEALPMRYLVAKYDCETLLVDPLSGDILLVTRDRINEGRFYVFSYPAAQQVPGVMFTLQQPVASFPWNVQVKGGDVSAAGDMVILRPHSSSVAVNALWWQRIVGPTEPLLNVFSRAACPVPVVFEPQGEAIAFRPDGLGYYTISEGSAQPIYFYRWELPPNAPSDLTATAVSSSRIDLFWRDNSDNETGFAIERSTDNVTLTFAQIATVGPNGVGYTDSTVAGATTYYYRVRAFNTAYASAYSQIAGATTPAAPPAPPAAPGSLQATAVSKSQINLSWADNSSDETGFRIERGLTSTSFAEIAVVGANVRAFSDTGLVANKTYFYRVRAYNANGNSAYSNTATAKTLRK